MISKIQWYFPPNINGPKESISDGPAVTFEGDYAKYIARECIQNSLDQHDPTSQNPVTVVFKLWTINRDRLPGGDELEARIDECVLADKSPRAQQFMKKAKEVLSKPAIPILSVNDYNTKGLNGDEEDERGTYYKLVKSTGYNDSMAGFGGGSFGLGKGAALAASALRTVFYTTYNDQGEHVFIGKSALISHNWDGEPQRSEGWLGISDDKIGYRSVRDESNIPSDFKRKPVRGTDIHVVGWREESGWAEELTNSIISNFWPAIDAGMLNVELKDGSTTKEINNGNIALLLESSNESPLFDSYCYYLAMKIPEVNGSFETKIAKLGKVKLFVKKGEDFPKEVLYMRKPRMVVMTKPYKRTLIDSYAAVLLCEDEDGNRYLRDLEPPEHDKWNPALGDDKDEALKVITDLEKWVRDSLKTLSAPRSSGAIDFPGIAKYLRNNELDDLQGFMGRDRKSDPDDKEGPTEIHVPQGSVKKSSAINYTVVTVPSLLTPDGDDGHGDGDGKGDGGEGNGKNTPDDDGKGSMKARKDIRIRELPPDDGEFNVVLYSSKPFNGDIKFLVPGDSGSTSLDVKSAQIIGGEALIVDRGNIHGVAISQDRPMKINFSAETSNNHYALTVEGHENGN